MSSQLGGPRGGDPTGHGCGLARPLTGWHWAGGYPESGLVLVDPLGAPIRPEAYSDRFRVLCREAELRKIDLHYVRHTLAGIMHRAGVAPADAAALLGHTLAVHLSAYVPSTERGARTAASGLGIALTGTV
jgi:integrase